ncbi:MAG TPA: MFS transporter [Noviherbaspirillum sp.]|uniref:MFS transporter n=1 Tax=Noviherbaspirillum sp. TaxID=1926288 RepID=UPI002DDD7412|nr:MFS transporter [Noviherbaspirillum sp.]HEV2610178.1 MFS transporter [Noviherbaspirillum sp.]
MNLLALIAMMVLTHITFTGSRVSLTLFAIHLGAPPVQVGFLMSLLAVIPMLLSVHAGRWTDRTGVVKPTLIALVLMIIGTLLPGTRPSLSSLYVASVLLGSGFMLTHVAINNAVGHASTAQNRTTAFSYLALGFSISTVLGPVIAGFAIDWAGHAATFLMLSAFPVIALIFLGAIRKLNFVRPTPATAAKSARVIDLLRHAPLRAVFIASGLLSMGWDLFTFMVPIQGARIGLSASTIGLIMGAFGIGTFVVRLLMGPISRTFPEWRVLTGALAITAFVYLLFPLFHAVPVLLALAFLLGLGLGSALPMIMSLIHKTAPPGRTGEAVGVRSTLINASQTVLPLFFGALGSAVGTVPVFWALAGMLASGGVFAGRRKEDAS